MLVAFALTVMTARAAESGTAHKRVGVDEFYKLWAKEKLTVLDVRTPKEFAEGHIPGAKNIDFYADDFAGQLARLDKSKPYLSIAVRVGAAARRGR